MLTIDLSPRASCQAEELADRFGKGPDEIVEEAIRMAHERPEAFGRWLAGEVPGDDSGR